MKASITSLFDEKKLLYQIQVQKSPEAFAKVYDAHVEKIYRFIFFKINNKEEAQDLTSDVFLKVWQYLTNDKKKNVKSLSGLIYQSARNGVIDLYRKRAKEQTHPIEYAETIGTDENQVLVEVKHDVEILFKTVRKLKEEYQEVILLKYVEDLSTKEIAEILGKNKTNVRVLLHRATKKLEELHNDNDVRNTKMYEITKKV